MVLDFAQKLKEFNDQRAASGESLNSRVLLVDSTNTYIRCFCGTPSMNDDGEHIGGVVGFLKSVGMVSRHFRPTRIICVFDGKGGSQRRRQLYENYKDNKRSMQRLNRTYDFQTHDEERESMKWQMHLLIELLELLPVDIFSVENIEADDTIAYLNEVIIGEGGSSIIMSTDKDFLQLIGDSCSVYNPIKKKLYTPTEVIAEFGVHPNNFPLYRAIEGDKSDNIPGIKGIGPASIKKNFPYLSEATQYTVDYLISTCLDKAQPKNAACKKLITGNDEGIISKNLELMTLSGSLIAGTTKLKILDSFNSKEHSLNKYALTKHLSQYKLLSAFGDYDTWLLTSWSPLTRFRK